MNDDKDGFDATFLETLDEAARDGFDGCVTTDEGDLDAPDLMLEDSPVLTEAGVERFSEVLGLPARTGAGMFGPYIEVATAGVPGAAEEVERLCLVLAGHCSEGAYDRYVAEGR